MNVRQPGGNEVTDAAKNDSSPALAAQRPEPPANDALNDLIAWRHVHEGEHSALDDIIQRLSMASPSALADAEIVSFAYDLAMAVMSGPLDGFDSKVIDVEDPAFDVYHDRLTEFLTHRLSRHRATATEAMASPSLTPAWVECPTCHAIVPPRPRCGNCEPSA